MVNSKFPGLAKRSGAGKIKNSPLNGAGFTLIELLIVMSIIGILAAISIFGISGARESARDGRRKSDLEAVRSAIEIYKADCDQYPPSVTGGSVLTASCTGPLNTYMERVPEDPLGGSYFYSSPGTTYILCSTLEDPPSPANDTTGCGSCAGGPCEYRVINP
jgi:general secretion pathway protein G